MAAGESGLSHEHRLDEVTPREVMQQKEFAMVQEVQQLAVGVSQIQKV